MIDGSFDVSYVDRQAEDGTGKPTQTRDELVMRAVEFTDPQRNEYTLEQKTAFQPPIPGYQTGGGDTETNASTETTTDSTTTTDGGDEQTSQWSLQEAVVAGTDDGQFGRYVYAFGRDGDGELYVLSTGTFKPVGETGKVHKIVPPAQGSEIETATGAGTASDIDTGTATDQSSNS